MCGADGAEKSGGIATQLRRLASAVVGDGSGVGLRPGGQDPRADMLLWSCSGDQGKGVEFC